MLFVGSDDGVYRTPGLLGSRASKEPSESNAQRVLQSGRVLRVRTFAGIDGVFAATKTGLYHSPDGEEWTNLGVPQEEVYAVGASDGRIYAGTRPAHVYSAEVNDAIESDDLDWRELDAFRELAERDDWGIDRHENIAQVRDVCIHPESPERVVAGVEVGGVYVSDDGGQTWQDRRIEGFDAPHTDDIHHVELAEGGETIVAATGSGLYRTTDTGRTWERLDEDHRQEYFRESLVHDGTIFVGGSPTPPSYWEDDLDHALFECRRNSEGDGQKRERKGLETVSSPVPDEVAVGWCENDGDVVTATNRGTLLHRDSGESSETAESGEADEWQVRGSVPAAESVHGRCIPLAWDDL